MATVPPASSNVWVPLFRGPADLRRFIKDHLIVTTVNQTKPNQTLLPGFRGFTETGKNIVEQKQSGEMARMRFLFFYFLSNGENAYGISKKYQERTKKERGRFQRVRSAGVGERLPPIIPDPVSTFRLVRRTNLPLDIML